MSPVSSARPAVGSPVRTAQKIDLDSISPDRAVRELSDSVTKRNGAVPKRAKPSPSTQRSGAQSNQKIPTAYVVTNTNPPTRTNVDAMDPKRKADLDDLRGWTAVQGGKFGVRFCAAEFQRTGVRKYEIGGGKSVVKLPFATWAEAAKEAVRLSANGALTPRLVPANGAYSNYEPPRATSRTATPTR
jgi:hypothetical protein